MYVNRAVKLTPENMHRFCCFIVFEPASARISENDILVRGEQIRDMFDKIYHEVEPGQTIKDLTLKNRLIKIGQMLDLLVSYDNLIITRFFDRIWRRYSYVSNISEMFLDYPKFVEHFPEYKDQEEELLAQRIDGNDDDEDPDSDDSNDDSDSDTKSDKKAASEDSED